MNFIEKQRDENSPYTQLLMLIGYIIAGLFAFSIIALIIIVAIYGLGSLTDPAILSGAEEKYRPALQILLAATSVGMFLAPPLFLALTERRKIKVFYGFKKPEPNLLLIVLLIMIVSMPVMEWTAMINQKMVLPDYLKWIETWMREKEDQAMQTTLLLLKMKHISELVVNLLLIALLPGIAEELMFRGAVQRSFLRIFKNPHVAIWTSAFLFSAIHLQFYGFLPRFLLGAGFGYIYYWSGNLWYSMLAHFLNNAYAVCVAWYMQKNNIPLSEADNTSHFVWYGYLISFILTIFVFQFFKNKTSKTYEQQLD
ncbi:CPBP family intramembrane metalloprotease [Pedobacter panaciterrae]|uniref:CPBP family intramembrane glutamic endopeptidase n=1 Tax=Pedobacter panaciterrae TaxID=363849 RepID=UPI00155DBFA1|nr:CPBP family intramembrane glutamic endopeptidase [Pedobacter panaciterrae]NQX55594.1 CPBP family intramembrane metalloprotease [Pedobacter panaciterrae]